jgi:hypothetical protein
MKKTIKKTALALCTAALAISCSSSSINEDATAAVAQAVEESSNSSDATEVAQLMRGMRELKPEAIEGFHCDSTPEVTYAEVCGKQLPATTVLEWTDCAGPRGHRGHGAGCKGGRGAPADAGTEGAVVQNLTDSSAETPPTSSGKVELSFTYDASAGCDGAIAQSQKATYSITRTRRDGSTVVSAGTTRSSADLVAGAPPRVKSTEVEGTRTVKDASGAEISSVAIKGTKTVAFSSDSPPVRTVNGAFSETASDGAVSTTALVDVVHPPRNVCPFPTAGTVTRTLADGTSHVLAYGPECGDATLDGAAVELHGHGEGRGEGPPPGSDGGRPPRGGGGRR